MLELQNVYKNLHWIQSIFNFGCFINIFVSMKIKLLRLNATLLNFDKISNNYFEKNAFKFKNVLCIGKVY